MDKVELRRPDAPTLAEVEAMPDDERALLVVGVLACFLERAEVQTTLRDTRRGRLSRRSLSNAGRLVQDGTQAL